MEATKEALMSLAHRAVAMMLPVTDVDRARMFYAESLGLDYTGTNDEGSAMFALDGGATLVLLPRPDSRPSESTAMSFEVDDVPSEISTLEEAASPSRTTTCPTSRPSTTSASSATSGPRGSRTPTATCSACTRP